MRTVVLDDPVPAVAGTAPWGTVPARDDPLLSTPDLLVVGAGVAGLAVAAAAVAAGIGTVQVVDRGPIAAGATGRNAGALIPDVHALTVSTAEADLGRRGLALHRRRSEEYGYPLRDLDWLAVATGPPTGNGPADGERRWLPDARAVATATGGAVDASAGVLVTGQAATDPVAYARALAARVPHLTSGVRVTGVTVDGPPRVETSAGPVTPGAVVLATGIPPSAWLTTRRRWVTGHLAVTGPLDPPLGLAVGGDVVVVPQPDGRLLVGGTRDGEHPHGEVDPTVVDRIRRSLDALVPAAAGVPFEGVWTGQRPVVDDDLPLIDDMARHVLVVAGLYHTGVLTSPAVAEAVVTRLRDGRWPGSISGFHRRPTD